MKDMYYQPKQYMYAIPKPFNWDIFINLSNNELNFEKIQEILYKDKDYYQFIKTDHPEYDKLKELYRFLTI